MRSDINTSCFHPLLYPSRSFLPPFIHAGRTYRSPCQHPPFVHDFLRDVFTMRFGREMPWHQVPKWADFYIQYDEWKSLAKAGKTKGMFAPPPPFLLVEPAHC